MTYPASLLANAIRILVIDCLEKAGSGHPGMPLGMADVLTVLFSKGFLKIYPQDPSWANRDRLVLSSGHGSALLYTFFYLIGMKDMSLEELQKFRQLGSLTPGHPEYGHTPGIEMTTGPLGQGLASAVGMALAEKMLRQEFGKDLVHHKTYVIVGDGCLMEGLSQEAISLAGHWKLDQLIVLFDDNHITIDGDTSLSQSDDTLGRFNACGWNVFSVDGHDHEAIEKALEEAQKSTQPVLIACRTIIGYGAPHKMGSCHVHGSPLGPEEAQKARHFLKWPHQEAFYIPKEVFDHWRALGQIHKTAYQSWGKTVDSLEEPTRHAFQEALQTNPSNTTLPKALSHAFSALKQEAYTKPSAVSTRQASGAVLKRITPIARFLGGSADLAESTCTAEVGKTKNLCFGVREHAMAAILNGIALHGGFIPYGATFFVFSDYARPAIRLSALMALRVIYIMTHDSIGLGEDGPTHQPIEHLTSFRAMPGVCVFRPADAVEVIESWQQALQQENPSLLVLSRQKLPFIPRTFHPENLSSLGAYVVSTPDISPKNAFDVHLWASGSEVSLALRIQIFLKENHSLNVQVISAPCLDLFWQQTPEYQNALIHAPGLHVALEAGSCESWYRIVGKEGLIFGLHTFGASGAGDQLFKHFGFSEESIGKQILSRLKQ